MSHRGTEDAEKRRCARETREWTRKRTGKRKAKERGITDSTDCTDEEKKMAWVKPKERTRERN
jgi:hypothetical protein